MSDEISPDKMFEFIRSYNNYKKGLSSTGQQALWYKERFNYFMGITHALQKIGIDDKKIPGRLVDFLPYNVYTNNEGGRKKALENLREGREFYEIALKAVEPSGYSESKEPLELLLKAYDEALFRINSELEVSAAS